MTEPCSCFYFEFDADATDDPAVPVCACGHVEDEHTKAGECEGEVSFAYLVEQLAELGRQIQAAQAASEDHPL